MKTPTIASHLWYVFLRITLPGAIFCPAGFLQGDTSSDSRTSPRPLSPSQSGPSVKSGCRGRGQRSSTYQLCLS